LTELRRNPVFWLMAFVPAVFVGQVLTPQSHTLLSLLSVLSIVPLAALLSRATESVAAMTGDTVGGPPVGRHAVSLVEAISAVRAQMPSAFAS
jgi:Ca2+:H+ antiporter